jgi:transmembrane sensor
MDRTEADIATICTRLREVLATESAVGHDPRRERAAFLEAFAVRNAGPTRVRSLPRGRHRRLSWALVASLAASAAGVWLWTRPVSFQVGEARHGRLGDVVESLDGRSTPLNFSDGSRLLLHEGGRMRVLSLGSGTARVLVENGILDADIAHLNLRKTRWQFEAGPYRVVVTGTKFQMAFSAREQSLSLSTQEGQVVVSGGSQPTPKQVSAGERIDLSGPAREASPSSDEAPSQAAASAERPSEREPDRLPEGVAPPARPTGGDPAWRKLLASGRFVEGLRAAERTDFQRVCQVATVRELLALADAARLFGSHARAVAALRMLRQRFPGTMAASTAAFKLGLVAFEKEHAYAEAARWFEICLREQPSGPLMGDSVGRLMESRLRGGDLAGARSDAEQYLRRFPEGPYASEARGILSK